MAAMGFSAQTTPFKPLSTASPYWFCYSCPHIFSKSRFFWAASRKVFGRRDCDSLATCVPFILRNMHQGTVRIESPSYVPTAECFGGWNSETEAIKKSKEENRNRRHPLTSISDDGSRYQNNQLDTEPGKMHQVTSSSLYLHLEHRDSTRSLRNCMSANAGNQDLQTAVALDCKNNRKSNPQCRPFDASTSQQKKYIRNAGKLGGPGYSRNPLQLVEQSPQKDSLSDWYLPGRSLQVEDICSPERSLQEQENIYVSANEVNGGDEIGNDSNPLGSAGNFTKRNKEQVEKGLGIVYDKVLVVDNISTADAVVSLLTNQYKHVVHACDTEVAKIDVKQETPVDHGEIICFSIYSGPEADFGNGKSCIWVDLLNGGKDLLARFEPFFKDPTIQKVWHNYSFDAHVIENYGLFRVAGFHADTMHMARLWNSSRRTEGGYSLESLTSDRSLMSDVKLSPGEELIGKVSMKTIFGQKKLKKDGSEGKVNTIPSVEELQTGNRKLWIGYSALDSISTLRLYQSLKSKLSKMEWKLDGVKKGNMFDFYEEYWRPFGELLVRMETEGMLVDRAYLAEIEKVAKEEQQIAADRFRDWAANYCPDAKYMNVGSDSQLRVLFFGGIQNRKDTNEHLEEEKKVKVLNIDNMIEEGKKAPTKYRTITLKRIFEKPLETDMYTASGWPSVSGDALKALALKVTKETVEGSLGEDPKGSDYSSIGGKQGIEAGQAISALCEVCSIDSLISNFILPLQGSHIAGNNGRVHCSLNINTETGRLSARRPNLQNQPALEKDRYKIRQAFIPAPGNSLIVADYGQLELRILAHLANCKSMLDAFKAGGDFHSRTAMNMYPHIREAIDKKHVLLEWHPQPGQDKPPVPLLKDAFASERRKAKMLNFSIAYGKTAVGLARDWKVSVEEAKNTVDLWYSDRTEVLTWQEKRKAEAKKKKCVHTLLGRARTFPSQESATARQRGHIERAAINTPVQGSAADVAMCAMLEISENTRLKELGWKLLLQVHDEVILEGPTESADIAKAIVVECMSRPFNGKNILKVDLAVDAKFAQNWYAAK